MEKVLTCQKVPSTCQRLPRMVTYYPRTAYSRTVDVGACGGLCREKTECLATKNRTAAISTPNGKRSIEIIEDCSCVTPYCYRVSAFEAFPEEYTDAKGNKAIRTKLIDMGKCVAKDPCPKRWVYTVPEIFDTFRKVRCIKKTSRRQAYVSIGGRRVEVATIDTCSCI
ncbi:uncharacterized protein LOC144654886 [Oculina patagonica]